MNTFERTALISCIATLQGVRESVERIEPKCFTELKMIDDAIEVARIAERVSLMRESVRLRAQLVHLLLGTGELMTYYEAYDELDELGLVLPKDKTVRAKLSVLGIKVAQRLILEREGVDV